MYSIDSRCDTEPENTLFAGLSVHLQPGNSKSWGSEEVKTSQNRSLRIARKSLSFPTRFCNQTNSKPNLQNKSLSLDAQQHFPIISMLICMW